MSDKVCKHCDGSGIEPYETSAYPPEPCSECKGKKTAAEVQGGGSQPPKSIRQHVYDWMNLPTHEKVARLKKFNLFETSDLQIRDNEIDLIWIKRAKDAGVEKELLEIPAAASPETAAQPMSERDWAMEVALRLRSNGSLSSRYDLIPTQERRLQKEIAEVIRQAARATQGDAKNE